MRPGVVASITWVLWGITVILTVGIVIAALVLDDEAYPVLFAFSSFVLSFSTVGALIVARLPSSPIGWIMIGTAYGYSIGAGSLIYTTIVAHDRWVPLAGRLFLWTGSWMWNISLALGGVFLLLLFPTGRPPSRRWRILLYTGTTGMVLMTLGAAFRPGRFEDVNVTNPLGVRGALPFLEVTESVGAILLIASVAGAVISLIVRFRRSKSVERLQLKWLTLTGPVVVAAILVSVALSSGDASESEVNLSQFIQTQSLSLIPIAAGIAVLRYRLYDVDRVINKTIVYAAVTVVLVVGYVGGVLLARSILPLSNDSPAVVAISTLAVAALFRPLRLRVQMLVDARFYRARYDAAQAIDSFGDRLRTETDIDSLTSDLLDVVTHTVQPASASLWLRPPESERAETRE
jgi:hypothetical protein